MPARVRVAAGVSPMESTARNPTRTPSRLHDHRAAGRGQILPGSDGVDLGFREAGKRLAQGAVAVVTSVVVGQRKQVEPGRSQS